MKMRVAEVTPARFTDCSPAEKKSMAKIRLTLTVVREYEQNPEYYPEEARSNPQSMLDIDMIGFKDDPMLMMDMADAEWNYKGEIIASPASGDEKP